MQFDQLGRREFITLIGGVAATRGAPLGWLEPLQNYSGLPQGFCPVTQISSEWLSPQQRGVVNATRRRQFISLLGLQGARARQRGDRAAAARCCIWSGLLLGTKRKCRNVALRSAPEWAADAVRATA